MSSTAWRARTFRWVFIFSLPMILPLFAAKLAHAVDCNSNAFDDAADIVGGTSIDANSNGVPDECDVITDIGFNGPDDQRNFVPDPSVAVGNHRILGIVYTSIYLYDKTGILLESSIMDDDDEAQPSPGFFEEVGAAYTLYDPRTIYDQYSGRFVVTVMEEGPATNILYWLNIAISRSSDPSDLTSGSWHKYRLFGPIDDEGLPYKIDFHGLGVDEHAVYIAANVFLRTGSKPHVGSVIRVIDKAALLAGLPALQNKQGQSPIYDTGINRDSHLFTTP